MADPSPPKAAWLRNSNIQSALITSVLGLMGTLVTIIARRPAPSPMPPPPTPDAIVNPMPQPIVAERNPLQPNPLLNFVEFQSRFAGTSFTLAKRAEIVKPLIGRNVVWQGYVDDVTFNQNPADQSYLTVTLVEASDKLNQTMFKTPAYFRMPAKEQSMAERLSRGDFVKLMGVIDSHTVVGTIIKQGHIVDVEHRTPQRMTSAPAETTVQ